MNKTSSPPAPPPHATLLVEADLEDPLRVPLSRGIAVVLSRPHPTRSSPNQDAAAILPVGDEDALLVVADGMGGTRFGGEAAATVIRHLCGNLPEQADELLLRTAILNGIEAGNRKLLTDLPDSGTTLVAVEISGHTIRPYHVGDSVILVVGQRGKLKLQTVAHSPVGFAVEAGLLDEKEALHHHERHVISNAVGSTGMRIELGAPLALARRDTLLLASDGLTDNLSLDEIIELVRKGPLEHAVRALAVLARERMTSPGAKTPSKPDDLTLLAYRRSA